MHWVLFSIYQYVSWYSPALTVTSSLPPPLRTPSAVTCSSACLYSGESPWPRFRWILLPAPNRVVCTLLLVPNPHCARTSSLWPTSPWQQLHNALMMQQQQRLMKCSCTLIHIGFTPHPLYSHSPCTALHAEEGTIKHRYEDVLSFLPLFKSFHQWLKG